MGFPKRPASKISRLETAVFADVYARFVRIDIVIPNERTADAMTWPNELLADKYAHILSQLDEMFLRNAVLAVRQSGRKLEINRCVEKMRSAVRRDIN